LSVHSFEKAVLAARDRIGSGPPVVRTEPGAMIPYFGKELVEYRLIDGQDVAFHLVRRTLGLWVVTAAFDTEGNLI
jgi:hypothetical protein